VWTAALEDVIVDWLTTLDDDGNYPHAKIFDTKQKAAEVLIKDTTLGEAEGCTTLRLVEKLKKMFVKYKEARDMVSRTGSGATSGMDFNGKHQACPCVSSLLTYGKPSCAKSVGGSVSSRRYLAIGRMWSRRERFWPGALGPRALGSGCGSAFGPDGPLRLWVPRLGIPWTSPTWSQCRHPPCPTSALGDSRVAALHWPQPPPWKACPGGPHQQQRPASEPLLLVVARASQMTATKTWWRWLCSG
jgi:hypothetical protein